MPKWDKYDQESTLTDASEILIKKNGAVKRTLLSTLKAWISGTSVASSIHGADGKTTPANADELGLVDTEDSNALKKLTISNLLAKVKTYLEGLASISFSGSVSVGGKDLIETVNPLAKSQGVHMTYAASGSNGIQVLADSNLDMGTNDFSLSFRGSLPDWASDAFRSLVYNNVGLTGYGLTIHTDNTLRLFYGGGAAIYNVYSTSALDLSDNSEHEIAVTYSRESAASSGAITFYVDGVQFGAPVSVTAGTPKDVDSGGVTYILGTASTRTAGRLVSAAIFNRALTAAQVLALYQGGIDFAGQWGSQANLLTGVDIDFATDCANKTEFDAAYDKWSSTGSAVITVASKILTLTADSGQGIYLGGLTVGKNYRISLYVSSISGTIQFTGAAAEVYGTVQSGWNIIEFVPSDQYLRIYSQSAGAQVVIDQSSAGAESLQIGATFAIEPDGMQPAPGQCLDSSSNKNHAMQPASGSALIRPKKDFEFRSTNTWTASSAAQQIGGISQEVMSDQHCIADIITITTETTDVENITIGDEADGDRYVTATAPGTVATFQSLAAYQTDGTNRQLVITPAAEATMTVETIIRGFLLES